jgi:hypothetical protein
VRIRAGFAEDDRPAMGDAFATNGGPEPGSRALESRNVVDDDLDPVDGIPADS